MDIYIMHRPEMIYNILLGSRLIYGLIRPILIESGGQCRSYTLLNKHKPLSLLMYFYFSILFYTYDLFCGLVVRVPGYRTEMYCIFCEVRTEFIYVM
jgi:hypothetical protein